MTENQSENTTVEQKQAPAEPKSVIGPGNASKAKFGYWWGTGRRKTSVARVRIRPGSGKLMVNKKELDAYFTKDQDRKAVVAALKLVHAERSFDIFVNVRGGGTTGQAGAALLGVARALRNYDENYGVPLRDNGLLTRDPRMVERKKPGQAAHGGDSSSPNVNPTQYQWDYHSRRETLVAAVFFGLSCPSALPRWRAAGPALCGQATLHDYFMTANEGRSPY